MSISNRELVFFLLSHKLSQRHHWLLYFRPEAAGDENNRVSNNGSGSNNDSSNGQLAPPSSPPPPPDGLEEVKAALRESVEEFELRYTLAFSDLSSQLPVTTATAYRSFKSVMDEMFCNGINWGRVVGLFAFGGALCLECVDKEMSHMVPCVAAWMTLYLDNHVEPWIQSHGGWRHFAEIFGSNAAAEVRRTQDSQKRWLLVGVVVVTGVLLSALLAKKHV